jgi:predicted HicB family RNase H-like nuclease
MLERRRLDYYKSLEYDIVIQREEDEGEVWYIAYCHELGKYACYGKGNNRQEALKSFLEEKDAFIEYLYLKKRPVPVPQKQPEELELLSGVFNVRTSPHIHTSLAQQAKDQELSLNLYVNQILSAAIERNSFSTEVLTKLSEICNKMDINHYELTRMLNYNTQFVEQTIELISFVNEAHGPYMKVG